MNEKLRECPFCGSKPDVWEEQGVERVGCSNEECIVYQWPSGCFRSQWNTRAINTPKHETVEELREAYRTVKIGHIDEDFQCIYCNSIVDMNYNGHDDNCIIPKAVKWLRDNNNSKPEI